MLLSGEEGRLLSGWERGSEMPHRGEGDMIVGFEVMIVIVCVGHFKVV